jgi:hypothetical protein
MGNATPSDTAAMNMMLSTLIRTQQMLMDRDLNAPRTAPVSTTQVDKYQMVDIIEGHSGDVALASISQQVTLALKEGWRVYIPLLCFGTGDKDLDAKIKKAVTYDRKSLNLNFAGWDPEEEFNMSAIQWLNGAKGMLEYVQHCIGGPRAKLWKRYFEEKKDKITYAEDLEFEVALDILQRQQCTGLSANDPNETNPGLILKAQERVRRAREERTIASVKAASKSMQEEIAKLKVLQANVMAGKGMPFARAGAGQSGAVQGASRGKLVIEAVSGSGRKNNKVCLSCGRDSHQANTCKSTNQVDGSEVHVIRRGLQFVTAKDGKTVCSFFNLGGCRNGAVCSIGAHICCGCLSSEHGADACPSRIKKEHS